jgi:hypothetical protein
MRSSRRILLQFRQECLAGIEIIRKCNGAEGNDDGLQDHEPAEERLAGHRHRTWVARHSRAPRDEAPGGSASLRVTGRSSLRATREYPNHQTIIDLRVSGHACAITVRNMLKPSKRQYTFTGNSGTAYCDKPRIVRTACEAF